MGVAWHCHGRRRTRLPPENVGNRGNVRTGAENATNHFRKVRLSLNLDSTFSRQLPHLVYLQWVEGCQHPTNPKACPKDRCLLTVQVLPWNDLLLKQTTGCASVTDYKAYCDIDPGVGIICYKMQQNTLWRGKTIFKEVCFQSLAVILSYLCTPEPLAKESGQDPMSCDTRFKECQLSSPRYISGGPLSSSKAVFGQIFCCVLGVGCYDLNFFLPPSFISPSANSGQAHCPLSLFSPFEGSAFVPAELTERRMAPATAVHGLPSSC